GNFQYALEAAKKAVENAPDLKEARYNYAVAELHSGDLANSIVLLKELLLELPDYLPAQFILAAAYCCSADKETGLAALNELKASSMGAFLVYSCAELAKGLMTAQRHSYALNLLSAAMECEIINAEILNLFADCIRLKENENSAINIDGQLGSDSLSYAAENMRPF
ncbi:MAG: hypothetical protein PVI00_18090, partial [Desulfobacterales bacterium]